MILSIRPTPMCSDLRSAVPLILFASRFAPWISARCICPGGSGSQTSSPPRSGYNPRVDACVNGAFQGARAAGRTEGGQVVPDPIRYSVGDEVSDALTAADPSIGS